jgi:hypothetical protein
MTISNISMITKAMAPKPTVPAPTPNRRRILCKPTDPSRVVAGGGVANGRSEFPEPCNSAVGSSCGGDVVEVAAMATRVGFEVGVALGTSVGLGEGETAGACGIQVAVGGGATVGCLVAVGALAGVAVALGVGDGWVTVMVTS